MTNLFVEYYNDSSIERQKEIDFCLKKNIENNFIDKIYCFVGRTTVLPDLTQDECQKITFIHCCQRLTFNTFFRHTQFLKTSINILANSDIYFDESIEFVSQMRKNDCYALLRYEIDTNSLFCLEDGRPRPDSQDVWIFSGKIQEMEGADIQLGIRGVDNHIAYLIKEHGYNITNPCSKIKAYHYHLTNKRNYFDKPIIQPPYLLVNPE